MDGDRSAGVLLDTAVADGQLASEYIETDTHVAKDRTAVHRQARIRVGLCQLWHNRGAKGAEHRAIYVWLAVYVVFRFAV